jgi:hypothetical protein
MYREHRQTRHPNTGYIKKRTYLCLGLGPKNKNTYAEKFSESLSDFLIAKIDNQYFQLQSYETVLKNICRLVIS